MRRRFFYISAALLAFVSVLPNGALAQTLADLKGSQSLAARTFPSLASATPDLGTSTQVASLFPASEALNSDTSLLSTEFFVPSKPLDLNLSSAQLGFEPRTSSPQPSLATPLNLFPSVPCSGLTEFSLASPCAADVPLNTSLWMNSFDPLVGSTVLAPAPPREKFHWGPALWQSLEFLVMEHAFRLATDPYARYLVIHRPFWNDYWQSLNDFHMNRWGDGDSFLINYIGHPMQGAVSGNIFLQNDPQGRSARFGKSSAYWQSRLKAWVWAAAYSTYFEIGPVLSETALGNEGGYTYMPGCGWYLKCHPIPGKQYKPPTNNTGWVDFVITPTVGIGWIVLENAIETEFVDRLANGSTAVKYKLLRSALSPSKTLSNVLAGKKPWYRFPAQDSVAEAFGNGLQPVAVPPIPEWKLDPRWGIGVQYVSMDLPMDTQGCSGCRQFTSGGGFDFSFRGSRYIYFEGAANFFPGSGAFGQRGAAQEYLAGLKIGRTSKNWGLFSQVRPGFVHYEKTLEPGSTNIYTSTTRFALDLGGSVEYYASSHSTLRFRMGTLLIHYLTGETDPHQPPVSVLSDQRYTLQGSMYLSSGYVFRF